MNNHNDIHNKLSNDLDELKKLVKDLSHKIDKIVDHVNSCKKHEEKAKCTTSKDCS